MHVNVHIQSAKVPSELALNWFAIMNEFAKHARATSTNRIILARLLRLSILRLIELAKQKNSQVSNSDD